MLGLTKSQNKCTNRRKTFQPIILDERIVRELMMVVELVREDYADETELKHDRILKMLDVLYFQYFRLAPLLLRRK